MPNWVKNVVTVSENTMKQIKEKCFTDGILDFNKVIPMPRTLNLPSGSITDRAIYYAYISKGGEERKEIENVLKNTEVFGYENYWNQLQKYKELGHFKNIYEDAEKYEPGDEEKELSISSLKKLGDTFIYNIKEFGYATWYDWCIENWGTKWAVDNFVCNNNTMIFYTAWAMPEPIFEKLSEMFPNDYIEVKYADECYSNYNNGELIFKEGISYGETELDEDFAAEVWNEDIEKEENDKDITNEMFE